MFNRYKILTITLVAFAESSGAADLLWDDAMRVPAVKLGASWLSCSTPATIIKMKDKQYRCYEVGLIKDVDKGAAVEMSAQQIADIQVAPIVGVRVAAVGIIPALLPGNATANLVDKTSVLLAYKARAEK